MKTFQMRVLMAGLALSLMASGCTSYTDASGRTVLGFPGQTRGQTRTDQPSPERLLEAKRDARVAELESSVSRLRNEIDGIGNSINNVASRTDAVSRQTDTRGAEATALRNEIAALRDELNAVKSKLDAVPTTLSRLMDENNKALLVEVEKAIKARPVASSASSSNSRRSSGGGSGKYYEHEVGTGQTLSEIARVYDVSVAEIMAVSENNLKSESMIRVGQKLLIPVK